VKPRNARVAAALAAVGIEPDITILDGDAKTAAAAAEQLGCEVGAIANSLVFECDGSPLLVMASGAHRVDTDLLAQLLDAESITKASRHWCAALPIRRSEASHPRGIRPDFARSSTRRWLGIRSCGPRPGPRTR
jgi:hypothetical protein